jgi:hypothetical protein
MPMSETFSLYLLWKSTKIGISSLQGPHQDPQTFTSAGPLICPILTVELPSKHSSETDSLFVATVEIEEQSTTTPLPGSAEVA